MRLLFLFVLSIGAYAQTLSKTDSLKFEVDKKLMDIQVFVGSRNELNAEELMTVLEKTRDINTLDMAIASDSIIAETGDFSLHRDHSLRSLLKYRIIDTAKEALVYLNENDLTSIPRDSLTNKLNEHIVDAVARDVDNYLGEDRKNQLMFDMIFTNEK